jgi:hypothetical protein
MDALIILTVFLAPLALIAAIGEGYVAWRDRRRARRPMATFRRDDIH